MFLGSVAITVPYSVILEQENDTQTVREYIITGYSSSVDETDDSPFITASGERVRDGVVASNFLPFGTRLKISYWDDKIFVVKDRMNSRYKNRLDVWFPSKDLALSFGKRRLEVEILK